MTTQDISTRPSLVPSTAEASPTELELLWRELGHHLTCSIEVSEVAQSRGRKQHTVTVVAANEAPALPDSLRIVFQGVGLEVVPRRPQGRVPAWADSISSRRSAEREQAADPPDDVIPWPDASPRAVYVPGEVLYPGDTVRYEFRVPTVDIPYFDYRLTAGLSWQHLFWSTNRFSAPDEIARAPFLQAFKSLNELDVHAPLLSLLKAFPTLSRKTSAEDVAPFLQATMTVLPHVHVLRSALLNRQETAPTNDIRELLGLAADYTISIEEACGLLHGGLTSGKIEEIRVGVQALDAARLAANAVNASTEKLLAAHGIGDEEVGYRYR